MPRFREEAAPGPLSLADLRPGERAQVAGIAHDTHGFLRRRLLELGFTRGALVDVVMAGAFGPGDPVAYRVRGTTIALRKSEAAAVAVRPVEQG